MLEAWRLSKRNELYLWGIELYYYWLILKLIVDSF